MRSQEFLDKVKKLKSYRGLRRAVEIFDVEIAEFSEREFACATRITVGELDKIKTFGGKAIGKAENYSEREIRLALLIARKEKAIEKANKIDDAIMNIENLDFRNAVYSAYVLGMTDEEIGFAEHISDSTARWRRHKGIDIIRL